MVERFERWQLVRGLAKNTVKARSGVLGMWLVWGDPFEASSEDVEAFLAARRSMTTATRAAYLSHLSVFYRWAIREGLTDRDPTVACDRPRMRRRRPRPVDDSGFADALATADVVMTAWLMLAGFCGLRCCEIAGLGPDDVRAGELWVTGKGGKDRTVPLRDDVGSAVRAAGLPFTTIRGGPVSPAYVSDRIGRHLRSSGVDATAHQLRHWFASSLARGGTDLLVISELLGHDSCDTTRIYTRLYQPAAVAAVDGLNLRPVA